MDGYFALRLEGWIKDEIKKMDRKERASLVESIRLLLEHAAREHKAGITKTISGGKTTSTYNHEII